MKKHIILIFVSVLIALILCGVSSAADSTDETQNSTISGADPIINGTVYINESGHVRVLPNATVTVNSSTNKNLATTKTDQNGYYSLIFYSTATQFNVTATYTSSNPVTKIVTVTLNPDGNYYGTGNFTLTPIPAQVTGVGAYYDDIWVQEKNSYNYAGLINVQSPPTTGTVYSSYCIDLYTDISINDYLYVNGPFPGTTGNFSDNGIDWGKVNYIINHYTATNDTEAAAIQAAIWYFTSAPYGVYPGNDTSHPGYYQYMTYNSTYGTPYDGYSTTYGGIIAQRAWQIINSATTLLYPSTVTVSPVITTARNGDNVTVIATVKDQFGNPLQNVTVNFTRTSGNLSVSSGLTNSSGQISTILSGVTSNSTSNVIATVTGNYGTLLYDDQYNQGNRTQNLAFISLSPYALAATSEINYAIQANVTLAKTVNGASSATVNVGDLLTFIITATCTGANNATGIMINETLPQGFVPTSIIASNGTYINGIWTIPLLRTGTSATLTIIGNATAAMAGKTLNNTAVRFFQVENNPQPSTVTTPVYTKEADVAINKTVNGVKSAILNVGDVITYLITATNNGPDNATGLQIKDLLPSGFIFQSANTYGSGTYNNVTGIWNIGNLVNGVTATLNITGIVNSTWAGLNTTNYA
ncbi:MAG: Ig-like domain-containing protein, partial [Methanobacterium sp.]